MFLPIYSQHAERNTIIFSSHANLNALNWHSRPEVTSSHRTTEHYYPFISDNFHSFDRGNGGYYKTKRVGQKSLSKKIDLQNILVLLNAYTRDSWKQNCSLSYNRSKVEKEGKSDIFFTSNFLSFMISLLQKHLVLFPYGRGIIPFLDPLKVSNVKQLQLYITLIWLLPAHLQPSLQSDRGCDTAISYICQDES